jgi:nitroreductase
MPDALELLKTRTSVKPLAMTKDVPTQQDIDTILTIGARVPDHGKLEPWRFIVFEGDARTRAGELFAKVFKQKNPTADEAAIATEQKRFSLAPLVIGVVDRAAPHPKIPEFEQTLSVGASAMNIVTAANALGYGANWVTGWMAFDRDVMNGLGLAENEKIAGFIHIGRTPQPAADRPRPELSKIVTRF